MEVSLWLVGCLLADSSDSTPPQALATHTDLHLSSAQPPTGTAESPRPVEEGKLPPADAGSLGSSLLCSCLLHFIFLNSVLSLNTVQRMWL